MKRRLAAILAADVVGYSRMVRADEEGTITALQIIRSAIIDPAISSNCGRIVKLMGDGILAEFASVVDAVRSAVAIQKGIFARNEGIPEDQRIVLRIGVNLGDVVIEGQDIHGDGVNVAARLEGLAKPGGICVSDTAHEQIRDRLDLFFEDMGERKVKNIERPVRIWHWRSKTKQCAPKPQKIQVNNPTLFVSLFKNLSEDPEQAYFAEGVYEDIVTGLSKNSALTVISQSFDFIGCADNWSASDARQIPDAQYLLEGSVRKSDHLMRVTAQLVDTSSGSRVWAERYDREMSNVFELQDEIVGSILHALCSAEGVIEKSTRRKRTKSSSDTSSAYDCYLQGRHYFYKYGDAEFDRAEEYYLKAVELDEDFAPAYSAIAWLYFVQFKLFRSKPFDEIRPKTLELALKALHIDNQEYRAHWVLGGIYLHDGNHVQSISEFDKALEINSNDANLLAWSAEALVYSGQLAEAIERCDRAVKINHHCPDWYYWIRASALFHQGNYEEALAALSKMSTSDYAGKLKAAVYAYLGDQEKALAEARQFMKLVPTFSIGEWARTEHYSDPAELERCIEGLHKAGLPE
jgi:adenylate cyclase